nr:hypothetical protein [Tanacetum cinerariifolium]
MTNPTWIESMQEEVLQFKRLGVWVLVPALDIHTPLTLKWLFKNKPDEENIVIRNKSRLVVRGYCQEEGIDFKESFALGTIDPTLFIRRFDDDILVNYFFKGTIDPTLFIRRFDDDILVVHVYVDDIIFGSTHPRLSQSRSTSRRLKGSFIIFRGIVNTGLWYSKDSGFELTEFSDADYARCKDTFKSTSGGAKFLGKKLVSWSSKKQDCTAMSTAESKYVSLSA